MKYLKNIFWGKWKITRTIWPYPEGYGVIRHHLLTGERVLLDTGLSHEEAEKSCKELNQ